MGQITEGNSEIVLKHRRQLEHQATSMPMPNQKILICNLLKDIILGKLSV